MLIDGSGTVIDTIVLDDVSQYNPKDGIQVVQSDIAGIGWTYSNGQFTMPQQLPDAPAAPPADPVPSA